MIHRDIKGKNILVDQEGVVKVADFGSAKQFEDVTMQHSPSLDFNYTPLWTAPEVLSRDGEYDCKIDIWSLGCVIIEMATGKPPWSELKFENPFRALFHIGNSGSHPEIPRRMSEMGKDFLRQCFQRYVF